MPSLLGKDQKRHVPPPGDFPASVLPKHLDKTAARRARLTREITAQVNAATTQGEQTHRVLASLYAQARTMAVRGDLCPAEALRNYLSAYLPALRDHRFGRRDWTSISLSLTELRLLRATQALCSGGEDED